MPREETWLCSCCGKEMSLKEARVVHIEPFGYFKVHWFCEQPFTDFLIALAKDEPTDSPKLTCYDTSDSSHQQTLF